MTMIQTVVVTGMKVVQTIVLARMTVVETVVFTEQIKRIGGGLMLSTVRSSGNQIAVNHQLLLM